MESGQFEVCGKEAEKMTNEQSDQLNLMVA